MVSRERLVCLPPRDGLSPGSSSPTPNGERNMRTKTREEEKGAAPLKREDREYGGGLTSGSVSSKALVSWSRQG